MSVEEKFHLDVHKWVWSGDNIEDDPRITESERINDDDSEGGYIEPMGTVSHSKVSSKQVSRKQVSSAISKAKSLLPTSSKKQSSDKDLSLPN